MLVSRYLLTGPESVATWESFPVWPRLPQAWKQLTSVDMQPAKSYMSENLGALPFAVMRLLGCTSGPTKKSHQLTLMLTDHGLKRVIHRADYQMILLNRAIALGANVRLGAEAVDIDFEKTQVVLLDGSIVTGDVIVGADGKESKLCFSNTAS